MNTIPNTEEVEFLFHQDLTTEKRGQSWEPVQSATACRSQLIVV